MIYSFDWIFIKHKSLMNNMKNKGSSVENWGSPKLIIFLLDHEPFNWTMYDMPSRLFEMKEDVETEKQLRHSFMISKEWSTKSKAFLRSKNTWFLKLSIYSLQSSIKVLRADLQDIYFVCKLSLACKRKKCLSNRVRKKKSN